MLSYITLLGAFLGLSIFIRILVNLKIASDNSTAEEVKLVSTENKNIIA